MDRQIVYPASIPLDTDFLSLNRNTMVALGYLAQATLGTATIIDGLACTPTTPASLSVSVGPGSITSFGPIDSLAYGSLPADPTDQIVKMGINLGPTNFTLAPPASSGQSVIYLIEASFIEEDASPIVLPYVNAANPAQPYSGPSNSGVPQNTQRIERVQLQLKAGAAANTGSEVAPSTDAGWVALYLITVNNGQTAVSAANIAVHPTAPFIPFKLPQLAPGFSRRQAFSTSKNFVVPLGVSLIRATVIGGGGGGGGSDGSYAGAGGGSGGYATGTFTVSAGATIAIGVGAGGVGSGAHASAGNGGTSSFGTFLSATGGEGGQYQSASSTPGGGGGVGSGGEFAVNGGFGADGQNGSVVIGGHGGASVLGGGGRASTAGSTALNGQAPGSGAGGTYNSSGNGGQGAPGLVIVEY
ncbi:glycine-rich domain-containing protein [Acidisoma sp. C75]